MEAIKSPAKDAVVQVIAPAQPITFDLKGLTEQEMAVLVMSIARVSGNNDQAYGIYNKLLKVLALPNDFFFDKDLCPSRESGNLSISKEHVANCVGQFGKDPH